MENYHCQLALSSIIKSVLPKPTGSHIAGSAYPLSSCLSYGNVSPFHCAYVLNVSAHSEPSNFKEAVCSPEWRAAMSKEIEALELNNTWIVCALPPGHDPLIVRGYTSLNFMRMVPGTTFGLRAIHKRRGLTILRLFLRWQNSLKFDYYLLLLHLNSGIFSN